MVNALKEALGSRDDSQDASAAEPVAMDDAGVDSFDDLFGWEFGVVGTV
jgi:hypothetical protein